MGCWRNTRSRRFAPHRVPPPRVYALRRTYARAAGLHDLVSGAPAEQLTGSAVGKARRDRLSSYFESIGASARLRFHSPLRLLPYVLPDAMGQTHTAAGPEGRMGFRAAHAAHDRGAAADCRSHDNSA